MTCEQRFPREGFQQRLLALNPEWAQLDAREAPDGDADLEGRDFSTFDRSGLRVLPGHPQARRRVLR